MESITTGRETTSNGEWKVMEKRVEGIMEQSVNASPTSRSDEWLSDSLRCHYRRLIHLKIRKVRRGCSGSCGSCAYPAGVQSMKFQNHSFSSQAIGLQKP